MLSPDVAQLRYATCAGLLAYPDAPGADGRRLVPEVAAAPPAVSADRRTYTFRIRDGYRFSPPSGAPLTAETFRATLERTLSPRLGKASIAMSVIGDVAGAADYHAGPRAPRPRPCGRAATGSRSASCAPPATCPRASPCRCSARCRSVRRRPQTAAPSRCRRPAPTTSASQAPGRTVLERNPNYRGDRPRRPDRIVYLTGVGADEALRRADKGEVDYVPYDYDSQGPLAGGGPRDRAFGATSTAARHGDQRFFAEPGARSRHARAQPAPAPVPRCRDAARGERGARPARARRGVGRAADRPLRPARDPAGERRAPAIRCRHPTSARRAGSRPAGAARRRSTTAATRGTSASPRSCGRTCARSASACASPRRSRCLRGHDPKWTSRTSRWSRRARWPSTPRRSSRSRAATTTSSAARCCRTAGAATTPSCAGSRAPTHCGRGAGRCVRRAAGGGAREGRHAGRVLELRPARVHRAAARVPGDAGRLPVPRPRSGVRPRRLSRATR